MVEIRLLTEMSIDLSARIECSNKRPMVASSYKTFGESKYKMLKGCAVITPAILEECLGSKYNGSSEHVKELKQSSTNSSVTSPIPNATIRYGSSSASNSGSGASVLVNSFQHDGHRSLSSSHGWTGNPKKKPTITEEDRAAELDNTTLERLPRALNSRINTNASDEMSMLLQDNRAENSRIITNASDEMSMLLQDIREFNSGGRPVDDHHQSLDPSPQSSFVTIQETSFSPANSWGGSMPNLDPNPDYVPVGPSPEEMRITKYDNHSARIPRMIRFMFEKDGYTKDIPYTHPGIKGEVFCDRQTVRSHELVRIDCIFSNSVTKYVIVINVPSKSMGKVVVRYNCTGYEFKAYGYIEGMSEKFWAARWNRVEEDVDF